MRINENLQLDAIIELFLQQYVANGKCMEAIPDANQFSTILSKISDEPMLTKDEKTGLKNVEENVVANNDLVMNNLIMSYIKMFLSENQNNSMSNESVLVENPYEAINSISVVESHNESAKGISNQDDKKLIEADGILPLFEEELVLKTSMIPDNLPITVITAKSDEDIKYNANVSENQKSDEIVSEVKTEITTIKNTRNENIVITKNVSEKVVNITEVNNNGSDVIVNNQAFKDEIISFIKSKIVEDNNPETVSKKADSQPNVSQSKGDISKLDDLAYSLTVDEGKTILQKEELILRHIPQLIGKIKNNSDTKINVQQESLVPGINEKEISTNTEINTDFTGERIAYRASQSVETGFTGNSKVVTTEFPTVLEQVVEHVSYAIKDKKNELTIKLKPDNLGELNIKLLQTNRGITADIKVFDNDTRKIITEQMPILQEALKEKGINVTNFNLSYGDGFFQQKDNSSHGNFNGQGSKKSNKFYINSRDAKENKPFITTSRIYDETKMIDYFA